MAESQGKGRMRAHSNMEGRVKEERKAENPVLGQSRVFSGSLVRGRMQLWKDVA